MKRDSFNFLAADPLEELAKHEAKRKAPKKPGKKKFKTMPVDEARRQFAAKLGRL
jgi:hypothetical protein